LGFCLVGCWFDCCCCLGFGLVCLWLFTLLVSVSKFEIF
jgi:hypothetical protein